MPICLPHIHPSSLKSYHSFPYQRSSHVVQLHSAQHPLPTDRTVLHLPCALQTGYHMATVVERCICGVLPADTAQMLFFLRILPVCNTLAELLIVLPAADVGVTSCSFDEGARAVLLVIDPVSVVRIAVLEGVEAVAVALAELEGTFVGSTAVVEHFTVSVTVAVLDLALVVFGREIVVCDVAMEV
jgi:hypothetical protein